MCLFIFISKSSFNECFLYYSQMALHFPFHLLLTRNIKAFSFYKILILILIFVVLCYCCIDKNIRRVLYIIQINVHLYFLSIYYTICKIWASFKKGIIQFSQVIILKTLSNIYYHAIIKEYHYTCLLYTSPSPRDVEESRMPSSA